MRWYIPLFVLIITAFAPWVMEINRVAGERDRLQEQIAPLYTPDMIRSEFEWIKKVERQWSGHSNEISLPDDPSAYWQYLDRNYKLADALEQIIRDRKDLRFCGEAESRLKSLRTLSPINLINNNFTMKFGAEKMISSKPTVAYFIEKERVGRQEIKNDAMAKFRRGYLISIPLMFLVFALILSNLGLMIWVEIPRIIIAALFWPVALFVYPRDVRRSEQVKRAMQFVAQLASVAVGFFGGGMTNMVKAQVSPNGKSQTQSGKKGNSTFGYGLELYPQSSGIDAGLLVSPWYAHSHALPNGFTLSGFGFVEAGERKSQLFTNHSMNLSHAKAFGAMFTVETGGTSAGSFVQVGPRVNLVKIPGFPQQATKIVKSVVAGSFWRIRGPTHYQEWYLSWVSEEAKLPGGWKLSSEGMMRFRPGPRATIGQPQLILRHPRIRHVMLMTEFWIIGTQPTIRFGVQFAN